MGRRKIEDPRTEHYPLRINKEEREMLNYIYEKTGMKPATLFRTFLHSQYEYLKQLENIKGE